MASVNQLLKTDRPFLTDGGFETWLFFQQGFEAPEFAAIVLLDDDAARQAMRRYFDGFLAMAENARTGFVLDTNTWRGCTHWGPKLNRSKADMLRLSRDAVTVAKEIRKAWQSRVSPIIVNGVIGPAGDGYAPGRVSNVEEASRLHRPQIETLAQAGVDMISAITMTNSSEAIGITEAAREARLPVVVSFTVETDGHLPTGEPLGDAIQAVDAATNEAPCYYMVNCAHPDHFRDAVATGRNWVSRIGGVRANASRLSHAELDVAETLDDGNPDEFGQLHADLAGLLPNLRVIGGCCGTDHRHVRCVSQHLHAQLAL
ncbi:MAG: homocysteine S-methyltransferase family protein [Hyphomicrobiaceae bacterium]